MRKPSKSAHKHHYVQLFWYTYIHINRVDIYVDGVHQRGLFSDDGAPSNATRR